MTVNLHGLNTCCPIDAPMDLTLKKQQESRNTYSQELGNSWMKSLAHTVQLNMFKYGYFFS